MELLPESLRIILYLPCWILQLLPCKVVNVLVTLNLEEKTSQRQEILAYFEVIELMQLRVSWLLEVLAYLGVIGLMQI